MCCPHQAGRPARCCGTCHCSPQTPAARPLTVQPPGISLRLEQAYQAGNPKPSMPVKSFQGCPETPFPKGNGVAGPGPLFMSPYICTHYDRAWHARSFSPVRRAADMAREWRKTGHTLAGNGAAGLGLGDAAPGEGLPSGQAGQVQAHEVRAAGAVVAAAHYVQRVAQQRRCMPCRQYPQM